MGKYQVTTDLEGTPWQIKNVARDHTFICDALESDGGHNAGPDPVEYLSGAVNSCVTMSIAYCDKVDEIKNFKIVNEATTKELPHGQSMVSDMDLTISFDADMTQEEKQKFIEDILYTSTVYHTVSQIVKMHITVK